MSPLIGRRVLHPGAWWLWALGLATAASRTTHPVLLALIIAVAAYVVARRRSDAPWALAFRLYVWLGVLIVVIRILARVVLGGGDGPTVILVLPEFSLPAWMAGIRLLGPVSAEAVLGGAYDGMRLATMVICLGAANALANPKRLVYALPSALYEVGTSVAVALAMAPQLTESFQRVRRARRLRGGVPPAAERRRWWAWRGVRRRLAAMRAIRAIVMPVFSDALERSLALAAAMDSRGYGRGGGLSSRWRLVTGVLMLAGLAGLSVGAYGLLDPTTPRLLGPLMVAGGVLLAAAGFAVAGRRVKRTRYRPDRWRAGEWAVLISGAIAAGGVVLAGLVSPADGGASLQAAPEVSLLPPAVPPLALAAVVAAVVPAWLAPAPPLTTSEPRAAR